MAPDRLREALSKPVLVSLAVFLVAVFLPLVVGATPVADIDVGQQSLLDRTGMLLHLAATASVLAVPYGILLGVATLPSLGRTGVGYGTSNRPASFRQRADHVAGATLYAVLTMFSSAALFGWTVLFARAGSFSQPWGRPMVAAVLLVGLLTVPGAYIAIETVPLVTRESRTGPRRLLYGALYAIALVPSPFAGLLVLEWWSPTFDASTVLF